jgi:hypothetical protein
MTTTTDQVEFTEGEILASHDYAEPLVVGGVRCHGGFDQDGTYVSPRTEHRWPAIEAWEAQRVAQFDTPLLDVPLDTWPESFPNVAQTKLLLRHRVTAPTVGELTRIGTVEGFGAMLRHVPLPDVRRSFDEDVTGTAIDHLGRGLFEAHARDEAGFEAEAGHDRMWFLARDIAFENPVTDDVKAAMLARMGIDPTPKTAEQLIALRDAAMAGRVLPDDIDFTLEMVVSRMIGLLLIEISAFHGFQWAEAVLSDTDLVAGDGEAARIISYVRADETPHVAYLRTALSEMRDRTWVGEGGQAHDGDEMIARLWNQAIETSVMLRRPERLQFMMGEIDRALEGRRDADDLVEEMLSLGSVVRGADGQMIDTRDDQRLG